MASCSSLQEVAASIRENSFYAEGFGNISDAAVNRETLENILKSGFTPIFRGFSGLILPSVRGLYRLSVVDCEKDLIMSFARRLNAGNS